jgi:transposase
MAVAHSIVVRVFHMLSRHEFYQEPGAHDCDEQRRHQLVDRLARRLGRFGYRVSLEPVFVTA